MITPDEAERPDGNIVTIQDCHRYLGVPQANDNHEEAVGKSDTTQNLQRVRKVLKSQLI